jgi:RNA polymerase sigma-70 factor (ECF subfamily)
VSGWHARICAEAIRLGRLLGRLMPDEPEVMGLLALMLLVESRRAARSTPDGKLVLLADQDRGRWDPALVAEGQALVRRCLMIDRPGPYQLQAAINAVHSDAPSAAETDWGQVLRLYDQLLAITRLRWPPSTARSRSPSSRDRMQGSRWWTSWISTAITSTTRSAPTC